jgi:Flp pilus assembly protein CpaB
VFAVIALLAAAVTLRALAGAAATRARYGELRRMPVAAADLTIGHTISDADIDWRMLPVALVAEPIAQDPIGRTVIAPVVHGEVLLQPRVSGTFDAGRAAIIPRTARAISFERSEHTPTVRPGERVDLYASGARSAAAAIARAALILEADERSITVVVTETETPAVARAALDGDVILALRGEQ